MKKLLMTLTLLLLLPALASAYDAANTSGKVTSNKLVYTGAGVLTAVIIVPDASNDVSVVVYDNTSASGTEIYEGGTSAGDKNNGGRNVPFPIVFQNGLYVTIDHGGVFVEWIPK